MRRAVVLIVVMLTLSIGLGLWMDFYQRDMAREYLEGATAVRVLVLENQLDEALYEQSYLHARWQHDAKRMNRIISHHHTRAVTTAMMELATALEQQWQDEALRALDKLYDALKDIEESEFPSLENIL